MKPGRLLPYLIALVVLAWILGSLARSGTGGGSLLADSFWLIYLVELSPLVAVGLMIVLIISLIRDWKLLSDAIGFSMRRKPGRKKKNRTVEIIVWSATWLFAIMILFLRCGGLFCTSSSSLQNGVDAVKNATIGNNPLPSLPSLFTSALSFASLVDNNYFLFTFLGVLVVSSAIMVRAYKVSWDETRRIARASFTPIQEEGLIAVHEAIQVLRDEANIDPRTRIMLCYQKMIKGAADLGAPVGQDKTARELEAGIRGMFQLRGSGIATLTGLFEEARYSLHSITEGDSDLAMNSLQEIKKELGQSPVLEA